MLRREVIKMSGGLFGLGKPMPSRFPYATRPQPAPGVAPSSGQVIRARQVIIFGAGGGLFVYSGTPALGNLIASITATAGTDPYGNHFLPGVQSYIPGGQSIALQGGALVFYTPAGAAYAALAPFGFDVQFTVNPLIGGGGGLLIGGNPGTIFYGPSGDATGATDAVAINRMLAAGYAVQLIPGTYYVNAPLQYPANAVLRGAGPAGFGIDTQTTIKATAAMPAVLCSSGWLGAGSNTAAQTAVTITDLNVDGANLATHGIVTQNYDSNFDRLNVQNVSGDGLRMDAFSQTGAAQITTSGVANRVTRCTFQLTGRGLATNEAGSGAAVYTDGFAADNLVATVSGTAGIAIARAAGWVIRGNHLYGLAKHGIQAGQMFATRITGNYIETWGTTATAGTWRAVDGNTIGQSDDGPASVIAGNCIEMLAAPGNATSSLEGISLLCLAANSAGFAVTGNALYCQPGAGARATAHALQLANAAASSVLSVVTAVSNIPAGNWSATVTQVPNGGTINFNTTGV